MLAGAALAALAILGFWFASREPSYAAPRGDEIDILLELAGVFPDNYAIMWREHQLLRATDPEAQRDPSLMKNALFMHKLLTTENSQPSGDISVEVAYWFYPGDHRIHWDTAKFARDELDLQQLAADKAALGCWCDPVDQSSTLCQGLLAFGNYEFELDVSYKRLQCDRPLDPQRHEEFRRSLQTADRLISLYLEPLRRKPRWL